ncbi:hypothetical protein BpHYR1_045761 [Brachionus plicatilis]|uniref:Uncharacterized protein n=1 Tax=Brachionus plicatilis TaxID=10195 RepID=A0A3M7RDM7_BRAPC|nr:hypothetical protein BpHYR1_045761 [Brachionus plicatilis]
MINDVYKNIAPNFFFKSNIYCYISFMQMTLKNDLHVLQFVSNSLNSIIKPFLIINFIINFYFSNYQKIFKSWTVREINNNNNYLKYSNLINFKQWSGTEEFMFMK